MQTTTDIIYSWESELRKPASFFRRGFADLARSGSLGWRLFYRDFKAQYRETLFGMLWIWVPALTVSFTFILASQSSLISVDNTGIPYPAFIILGTVLWQTFADSVMAPLKAVDQAKPLLAKVNFPLESMIFAKTLEALLNFCVKLPLIVGVLLYFKLGQTWEIALFPAAIFSLIVFGHALGLLLVPIGGLYQDVGKSTPLVLTFWMFLTPVVFSENVSGLLGKIIQVNPVTPLLTTAREVLVGVPISDLRSFLVITFISLGVLIFAWVLARLSVPIIVERAGN